MKCHSCGETGMAVELGICGLCGESVSGMGYSDELQTLRAQLAEKDAEIARLNIENGRLRRLGEAVVSIRQSLTGPIVPSVALHSFCSLVDPILREIAQETQDREEE